ncbi:Ger(x)C family spore germination protein [Clostridium ganghwense]|uniref:Ger(X)C family spore germination protein n=1 Tax=Clostridium ganghwense TaxID=312089 RepID=A0ABT4CPY4_9CLOT|nr:Ger(x)C family spore germination protein [Clostridium ganghwense]MCY6370141.1 Ger(x)C family spore germination protein [Clostridium ganghwense]
MNKTQNNTFTSKAMNSINRFKILIIPMLILIVAVYLNSGVDVVPVEEIDIVTGVGVDIGERSKDDILYKISINRDIFQEAKTFSDVIEGDGKTLISTSEDRQRKSNKKFVFGLEKVIILGEEFAKYGIRPFINTTFSDPHINDKTWLIVCKGTAVDLLKFKITGYASSSDYMEGIIGNAKFYNFFPENYKLVDSYVRIDEEGRDLSVPYVEIKDGYVEITGMALFKKDKMVTKIGLKEARIMSILKEKHSKGILSIRKSPKEYVDYVTQVKRKAKCNKTGDKYEFTINLDFTGDIMCNELYGDFLKNPSENKKFESDMKKEIEEMCYNFLKKMQNEYKIDALELGRIAAAKYGRNPETDWNEIVSNSDIKINIKVSIDRYGRGDF